jgi:hypothetical protein
VGTADAACTVHIVSSGKSQSGLRRTPRVHRLDMSPRPASQTLPAISSQPPPAVKHQADLSEVCNLEADCSTPPQADVAGSLDDCQQQEPVAEELAMEEVEEPDDSKAEAQFESSGCGEANAGGGSMVNWAPAFGAHRDSWCAPGHSRGTRSRWGSSSGPLLIPPRPPGSTRTHKERQLGKLRQWQHHMRQQSRLHRLCTIPAALCSIPESLWLPSERPRSRRHSNSFTGVLPAGGLDGDVTMPNAAIEVGISGDEDQG